MSEEVLLQIGARCAGTENELCGDELEDADFWNLFFFTSAETDPDLHVHLLFKDTCGTQEFVAVVAADVSFEEILDRVFDPEKARAIPPDMLDKIYELFNYSIERMEKEGLEAGQVFLWSAL